MISDWTPDQQRRQRLGTCDANSWAFLDLETQRVESICVLMGSPGDSLGKESSCNAGDAGDMGSISGLRRSLEKEVATLQYSRLENPIDRGAWWATVYRVAKS